VNLCKATEFDRTENQDLLDLYNEMIKPLSTRINPLKYAIVTVSVSRQFADIEQAITFLDEASKRLEGRKDAQFLCRIAQAEKRLNLG